MRLHPADIQAYIARDWEAREASKARHWQEAVEGGDCIDAIRAADALRVHVERHALGAVERERGDDLADLLRFKQRIDAAGAAFRR